MAILSIHSPFIFNLGIDGPIAQRTARAAAATRPGLSALLHRELAGPAFLQCQVFTLLFIDIGAHAEDRAFSVPRESVSAFSFAK